ncbi:hypothetical protein ACOMCU_16265 [Lysinibacillus sp. UGB7]|uniref:hypothetical protein n=1 Tax=Lysinibacillus sp. UGB7 TaxID=3411039 RepID=UPI003B79F532
MFKLRQEILVYFGINCNQCKKEKSVHKLSPKELVYMGFNAYNVKKLEIKVCEKCYEEVKQTMINTEQGAAQWEVERKRNDSNRTELSNVKLNSYEENLEGTKLAVFYMDKGNVIINGSNWDLNGFLLKKNVVKVVFTQGTSKEHDSYHVFYKD